MLLDTITMELKQIRVNMIDVELIAKTMQSKGYCEKSSYQWVSHVLASLVDQELINKVAEIAENQPSSPNS